MSSTMPDDSLVLPRLSQLASEPDVVLAAPGAENDEELRLSGLPERIARFFERVEPRQQAVRYADALLMQARRKNGWQIARNIGDPSPWRTQRLLNRAHWDVDRVRDVVRDYVVEHLAEHSGVLALGELTTIKKGTSSVGVSPHYSTRTGRVENCQVAVFAAYVSSAGSALVDRELYLPGDWIDQPERRRRAGIPVDTVAASKVDLARAMVRRLASSISFTWVTGDVEYGRDRAFLAWLAAAGHGHVLTVPASHVVHSAGPVQVGLLGSRLATSAREVRAFAGPDGRRVTWASIPVGLAGAGAAPGFEYLVLVERQAGTRQRDVFRLAHVPEGTPLSELIRVAGARADAEGCLRDACERAGIDQYEVRTWKAWYRHVTLAMLAVAPRRVLSSSTVDGIVPAARTATP